MSYKKFLCLANSWKHGERCIAGIDLENGQWIRPISSQFKDGKVPQEVRYIQGYREPEVLDILEIPWDENYSQDAYKCENRVILDGQWRYVSKGHMRDITPLINFDAPILHNSDRSVTLEALQSMPFQDRRSLELIYVDQLDIKSETRPEGGVKWKAQFCTRAGHSLSNVTITDPLFVQKLRQDDIPNGPYLLTMSLSLPYPEGSSTCWKLIANVISLSLDDQIIIELARVGWTSDQARQHTGKQNRKDLTELEKIDFIQHLTQLS